MRKNIEFFVNSAFDVDINTEKILVSVYTGVEYRKNTEYPVLIFASQ